jgi:thymidylate synthase (FAD)
VLPNAIETKIAVTGNARAWREFIVKRNSPYADPEIRALAETIYGILRAKAPSLFLYTMGDEE